MNNRRGVNRLGRKGNVGRRNDRRRAGQLGLFANGRRRMDSRNRADRLGRGGNNRRRGRVSRRGRRCCGLGENGEWRRLGRWRGRRDVERMGDGLSAAGGGRKFGELDRSRRLFGLYGGRRRRGPSGRGRGGCTGRRRGRSDRLYQRRLGRHRRRCAGERGRLNHGGRLGRGNFRCWSRSGRKDASQRLRGGQGRRAGLVRDGFKSFHVDFVAVDKDFGVGVGDNDAGRRNDHTAGLGP
jgi:hypothetical protein